MLQRAEGDGGEPESGGVGGLLDGEEVLGESPVWEVADAALAVGSAGDAGED